MLRTLSELTGIAIRATDGRLGTVHDFYFDDASWRIRYCVVDTGRWFGDRYVLIAARALSLSDPRHGQLWVRLSRSEIRSSPRAESEKPVSRQNKSDRRGPQMHDRHLRSCSAVLGHQLQATDRRLGRVDEFLIDDQDWVIGQLIVDAQQRHAPRGARLLVAPELGSGFSGPNATVSVAAESATLLSAPIYQPPHHGA